MSGDAIGGFSDNGEAAENAVTSVVEPISAPPHSSISISLLCLFISVKVERATSHDAGWKSGGCGDADTATRYVPVIVRIAGAQHNAEEIAFRRDGQHLGEDFWDTLCCL